MALGFRPLFDHITVRGFKSIAAVERLPLRAMNVLIGANGSGKSNFIGAFAFLHAIREGKMQDFIRKAGGAERLLHFGSKVTQEIVFEVSLRRVNEYYLRLYVTPDDSLIPLTETTGFLGSGHSEPYTVSLLPRDGGREAGISDERVMRVPGYVRLRLGLSRLYHLHDTSASSPLRKTAQLGDNKFLRPDGSNLPAFLYLLKRRHSASYSLIRSAVQQVAPFFDDFILEPEALNPTTIRLAWRHVGSDQYFDASALSDGSLRFIALATLLAQPSELGPGVIIVDEPELGLHPAAITVVASLFNKAATKTQVILSTQSTLLLDHFTAEDVLVAERVGQATHIHRLEQAKLESWLEDYSLGQLWEMNQFGGRPK